MKKFDKVIQMDTDFTPIPDVDVLQNFLLEAMK